MSVTGTQVIDRLNAVFDDSANTVWSAARKLEFVNAAIDAAWGYGIKDIKTDSSKTLADTTFEYTPTATPELEDGFAAAYVVPVSTSLEEKVRLHRVRQRLNGTTWTVVVPPDIAVHWDGKVMHLDYNSRVARISAVGSSIELPLDYLFTYCAWLACISAITNAANRDVKSFEASIPVYAQQVQRIALASRRGLGTKLPVTYEGGGVLSIDPNAGRYST